MKQSSSNRKTEKRSTTIALRSTFKRIVQGPILLTIFVSVLALFVYKAEAKPGEEFDFSELWKDRSSTFKNTLDDEDSEKMDLIVGIIAGCVVFVVVALCVFFLCICCPICILAKMRSRRRGVVYRSANGLTVTTTENRSGTTITIGTPRAQTNPLQASATAVTSNPTMIAISNNANQPKKPYPVQQSVTVIPVMPQHQYPPYQYPGQSQAQGYSHQSPYPSQMPQPEAKGQYNPEQYNPSELPPPYPGLSREMDGTSSPYNPYYNEAPPASAPSMKQ